MFHQPIEVPVRVSMPQRADASALFAGLFVVALAAIVMPLWWAFCTVVLARGFIVRSISEALRQAKATLSFAGTAIIGR